ncbi:MAG TPA: VacJ family lipoprotein, partial [Comamonas denitrificans]|nr:VacJ family lipoprotein [Comamonas denitrificans]
GASTSAVTTSTPVQATPLPPLVEAAPAPVEVPQPMYTMELPPLSALPAPATPAAPAPAPEALHSQP